MAATLRCSARLGSAPQLRHLVAVVLVAVVLAARALTASVCTCLDGRPFCVECDGVSGAHVIARAHRRRHARAGHADATIVLYTGELACGAILEIPRPAS